MEFKWITMEVLKSYIIGKNAKKKQGQKISSKYSIVPYF
jgi:hypothetical protein